MSTKREAQDGATLEFQRNDASRQPYYQINEMQFENWQYRWNSKEEVIDHLLHELEKSMTQSKSNNRVALSIVPQD